MAKSLWEKLLDSYWTKARARKSEVYDLLIGRINFDEVKSVCLYCLGHPYFYRRLKKEHPNLVVQVVEDTSSFVNYGKLKAMLQIVNICNKEYLPTDMKQFDLIIMNPPYDGNLHLQILQEALKHADNVVNLSPVRWLQDPFRLIKKSSDYIRFGLDKDSKGKPIKVTNSAEVQTKGILSHLESLDLVSAEEALRLFDIKVCNLGIYYFKADLKNPAKVDLDTISERLAKFCFENPVTVDENKKDGWRVRWPRMSGEDSSFKKAAGNKYLTHMQYFYEGMKDGKPWYTFFSRNQNSKETPELTRSLKFNSEEECKNFCESLKTHFARYLQTKFILDINIYDYSVPYMGNVVNPRTGKKGYEGEWTDADFYKFFNLTPEEIKIVEETMKDYE